MFGIAAFVQSGRTATDFDLAARLTVSLLQLMGSKSFLREVSASVLLSLLEGVSDEVLQQLILPGKPLLAFLQDASSPEVSCVWLLPAHHQHR